MKKTIYALTWGIILIGCNTPQPTNNQPSEIDTTTELTTPTTNIDTSNQESENVKPIVEKCNCSNFDKFKNKQYYKTDLSFLGYKSSSNKSDSIFKVYSADSLRLKVKSIRFSSFDSIPEKFKVFKNVEHVLIEMRKNGLLSGLDIFPNLKSVFFWGTQTELNPADKWLNRIEGLYAEKSNLKGLPSFKSTPQLREIYFGHANIEPFPTDFDALKCLRKITLGAYRGNVDLSKIDLAQNPCIEHVEFHTWYDAFSGIPQGLDSTRNFKLFVNHQKLTKEEKEKIEEFKKKR